MTSGLQSMTSHLGLGVAAFGEDIAMSKVSGLERQGVVLGERGKRGGGGVRLLVLAA